MLLLSLLMRMMRIRGSSCNCYCYYNCIDVLVVVVVPATSAMCPDWHTLTQPYQSTSNSHYSPVSNSPPPTHPPSPAISHTSPSIMTLSRTSYLSTPTYSHSIHISYYYSLTVSSLLINTSLLLISSLIMTLLTDPSVMPATLFS